MGVVGKFKKLFKGKEEGPQPRLPDNRKQKKNGVVMARLPTRYFTGSNKMISATETYGACVKGEAYIWCRTGLQLT